MSNRQTLKKINDMTAAALEAMTDEQLEAMADKEIDLSDFTDGELESIKSGNANRELLRRVEATRTTK